LFWFATFHIDGGTLAAAFRQYFLSATFSGAALRANWLDNALAGTTALGIFALARRSGSAFARLFRTRADPSGSDDPMLSVVLGLGALGTGVLGLGLAGLLFTPPRAAAITVLALLALAEIPAIRSRWSWPRLQPIPVSWFTAAVVAAAGIVTFAGVFNAEMSWDALTYHLRVPSFYLYRHKIYDVWHLTWSGFPSEVEMLYALGMLVSSDLAARILNAGFGIMLLAVTGRIAARLGAPRSAAVLLLAASPLFLMLATRCYIDLGFALFLALSFLLLLDWRETGSRPALVASAVLAGFGLSSKYVGVLFLPAVLAAATPLLRNKRARIDAMVWSAAAFLPLTPWLLKNWAFTGNPVFPFLGGALGIPTELPTEWLLAAGFPGGTIAAFGRRAEALFMEHGRIDGPLVPTIAGLAPLLAFGSYSGASAFALRALAAWTAVWIVFYPEIRFYLPVLPLLLALSLRSLAELTKGERSASVSRFGAVSARTWLRPILSAGIIAGALYGASVQWVFFGPFSFPLGLATPETRLQVGLPPAPFTWYMKEYVNAHVPRGARILYASNFSTYYVERECLADFFFGTAHLTKLLNKTPDSAGFARELKRRGIGWILSTGTLAAQYRGVPGFFGLPEGKWREFKRFLATRTVAEWQSEYYTLYRVVPEHAALPLPSLPVLEALAFQPGDAALGRMDAAGALAVFTRPPPLLADVGSTFVRQGDAYLTMENAVRAERAFRRALALGSDNHRLHGGLAAALLRLNRAPEALPHALEALRQNPLSAYAAATLATNYAAVGRMDDARRAVREAVRLRPDVGDYAELALRLGVSK
jgi:tetratricopeptide (TPR) repeat protein